MGEVNHPIKETLLLGVLNVGLPTADVYSDIGLTYKLYTYLDRSSEEAEDNEASWNFERDPRIDDEVKILKGEKNKCLNRCKYYLKR